MYKLNYILSVYEYLYVSTLQITLENGILYLIYIPNVNILFTIIKFSIELEEPYIFFFLE